MAELQYQFMWDGLAEEGRFLMPCRPTTMWKTDPKLLVFTLSRHKFVSKMFTGFNSVLEVGCGDAFASRLIQEAVNNHTSIDFDQMFIEEARKYSLESPNSRYLVHDILDGPILQEDSTPFDAAYSLDVFEHIESADASRYATNVVMSLTSDGVFLCGCPSLESQTYASDASKEGHVNCLSGPDLRAFFQTYFSNVFLFSMNDEVVHTGFSPMSHYNFVLCVGPRPHY